MKNLPEKSEKKITYLSPIYLQLREIIRTKIEDGEYPPGTAIPSENELAATYGINRNTVRNAVDTLVKEGTLLRVQGKGVFVIGNKAEQSIAVFKGFRPTAHQIEADSLPVKEQTKIVRVAGDKFANMFKINPTDAIYFIRCIRLHENEVISFEDIYIPKNVIPELELVDSSVFSINEIFEFYEVYVSTVHQSLEIIAGDSRIRRILNDVPDDIAIIMMECRYEDRSGRVVEYERKYIRSDRCRFSVTL